MIWEKKKREKLGIQWIWYMYTTQNYLDEYCWLREIMYDIRKRVTVWPYYFHCFLFLFSKHTHTFTNCCFPMLIHADTKTSKFGEFAIILNSHKTLYKLYLHSMNHNIRNNFKAKYNTKTLKIIHPSNFVFNYDLISHPK